MFVITADLKYYGEPRHLCVLESSTSGVSLDAFSLRVSFMGFSQFSTSYIFAHLSGLFLMCLVERVLDLYKEN